MFGEFWENPASFVHTMMMGRKETLNRIAEAIIGAAIEVHRELGPGLLESAYEVCLAFELRQRGFFVEQQKPLPVVYKGIQVEVGYRIDLLVERTVLTELKAVARFDPIHPAKVINHLRLSGCHLGLLLNFNVKYMTDGIRRLVWKLPE